MGQSPEATARGIVAELQSRIDARDVDRLAAYWFEDAVLAGTSAYNQGDEVRAYVGAVASQDASLAWVLPVSTSSSTRRTRSASAPRERSS
jgi:hypothetical protein